MTDLTLEDVRILTDLGKGVQPQMEGLVEPATVEDLVEVLKEQGAEVVESRLVAKRYWPVIQLAHADPGRYLVLRLEGETT